MRQLLEESTPDFEVSARRAFEGVLGFPTYSPQDFHIASEMSEWSPITCRIQTSNTDFNLTLSLGIDESDLHRFFPKFESDEMKMDAIGEIANVIAGRLLGRRTFKSRFGTMKVTLPSFPDRMEMPQHFQCLRGGLISEKVRVSLGLVVKAKVKGAGNEA